MGVIKFKGLNKLLIIERSFFFVKGFFRMCVLYVKLFELMFYDRFRLCWIGKLLDLMFSDIKFFFKFLDGKVFMIFILFDIILWSLIFVLFNVI